MTARGENHILSIVLQLPIPLRYVQNMAEEQSTDVALDVAVLEVGRVFEYEIPSFHVISVTLREAKFQCEDPETVTLDRFIRSCDLLTSISLPAIARVPNGSKGACFVKVSKQYAFTTA